jgi:hypothetical protein
MHEGRGCEQCVGLEVLRGEEDGGDGDGDSG